jgi:hypothetical protein
MQLTEGSRGAKTTGLPGGARFFSEIHRRSNFLILVWGRELQPVW